MEKFAFLIHPMNIEDVYKKYAFARKFSPKVVKSLLRRRHPFVIGLMKGVESAIGVKAEGLMVVVPLLPEQFYDLDEEKVLKVIAKAVKVAAKEEAQIVGLGAFTAIPGDGGRKLKGKVKVPVTTGNTYTVAIAIDSVKEGLKVMGKELKDSTLAVFGASGSIGRTVSIILAGSFGHTILIGRSRERLENVADDTSRDNKDAMVTISTDIDDIRKADAVVTVSGAIDAVVKPEMLKPGAVVCDVARPRDVSETVLKVRNDVLVIDGGMVNVPGDFRMTFDIGIPKGKALACMAETMILSLEKRYEYYTLGKEITPEKVEEMRTLAAKHGFCLGSFRSFERELSPEAIEEIKKNAGLSAAIS